MSQLFTLTRHNTHKSGQNRKKTLSDSQVNGPCLIAPNGNVYDVTEPWGCSSVTTSEQIIPAMTPHLIDHAFDFLTARPGSYEQRVGGVDHDHVIHTQ